MWDRPPSPLTPSVSTCGCSTRSSTSPMRPCRRSSTSCFWSANASEYGTRPSRRTSGALLIPGFERTFDVRHELIGHGAVDDAVIEPEREHARHPRHDGVPVDDGTLFDRADTEDRHLRLIDDRSPKQRAEVSRVR